MGQCEEACVASGVSVLGINGALSVSEAVNLAGAINLLVGRKQKRKQDYHICVERSLVHQKKEAM